MNPRPGRVVASFNNAFADHCVDIFVRGDGTFGFEEYRRDPEDANGWYPPRHYAHQVFATEGDALARARATIAWMTSAG